jgi:DNA polymerase-1
VAYSNGARVELTGPSVELEERLRPITDEMNRHPLRVNRETWLVNTASAEEEAALLIDYCRQLTHDCTFRPNSSADCAKALFTAKGIKPQRLSKVTKRPLTDKDTLTELIHEGVPLAGGICDARSAITCRGQLRAWRKYAEAGQVQSTWNSLGAPHGRYTSELPSLTNRIVPIRETIEPDEGFSFLSLDLSQAEYVVWASLSGDLNLGTAFLEGKDFHSEMARAVRETVPSWDLNGVPERAAGKVLNFALLYQMGEYALARKLGCPTEIAKQIIEAYFAKAPTALSYIKRSLHAARKNGYVSTFYGRRRYCPEYQNGIGGREAHEIEKTLWNHICAGTSAEFLKGKQVKVWETLRQMGLAEADVRLSLNVFDECVFHVRDSLLKEVREITEEVWRRKEPGFLPFGTEIKTGKNWKECS